MSARGASDAARRAVMRGTRPIAVLVSRVSPVSMVAALGIALSIGCERDAAKSGDAPRASGFVDVTADSGVRFKHVNGASGAFYFIETQGSGLGFFDYDDDGDLDLYLVQSGALPGFAERGPFTSRLYRNDSPRGGAGAGEAPRRGVPGYHFTDVTEAAGCGATVYGTGCLLGDYDGDGGRDVFVYGWGGSQLFRNRRDGTFEDVTRQAGLMNPRYAGAAAFADFDRDGDLDLFVGNYVKWTLELHQTCARPPAEKSYCHPDVFDPDTDLLYRNNGNGTFTDVTFQVGITRRDGKALGAIVSDVDDDGDLDLFVANDSTPNFLYRNDSAPGQLKFTDASESSSVAYDRNGRTQGCMGVDFADVDGDLSPDLVVTNLQMEPNALYMNDGRGLFDDESYERGVARPSVIDFGWGVRFLDFEQDGDMDLLVVNGHLHGGVAQYDASQRYAQKAKLLTNDGKGRFAMVGADVGGPFLEQEVVGRGLATADLDDDGDLDLAINTNDHEAIVVEHAGRSAKHWLGVHLVGSGSNPDAIGARVDLLAGGRTQRQEVRGGSSWASWHDLRLSFGLGAASEVERVRVRWPLGEVEEFGPLAPDRYHRLVKGEGRKAQ